MNFSDADPDGRVDGVDAHEVTSDRVTSDRVSTGPVRTDGDADAVPWRRFLDEAERRLRDAGFPSAEVDARRIVEQASGFEPSELFFGLDEPATVRGVAHFDHLVERRLTGEPLQYVLGVWGFRTLDLLVDRRVLIPRPETEVVAEVALREIDRRRAELAGSGPTGSRQAVSRRAVSRPAVVVDLGTGSGAIALSLAVERNDVLVWATDVSADALAVARANLAGIGAAGTRVRLAAGSWFDALAEDLRDNIDVIVSNPPYIAADEVLPAEVRDWEPGTALVSGASGREALDHLVTTAPEWLLPGGALVVELASDQAADVAALAREVGYVDVEVVADLAGRDRMVVARRSPAS